MRYWCALALSATGLVAQANGQLKARELFYTPPPEAAPKTQPSKPPDSKPPETKAAAKPAQDPPVKKVTTPSKPVKPPSPPPLGIRYAVLKRDAEGRYAEIDPQSTFHSGDRIRLRVSSNGTGYLYVVMQGSSGNWRVLFPSPEVAGGDNLIERGRSYQIPPGDSGQFYFDDRAGVEKLFLVLSRHPERDLDKLIYSMGAEGQAGSSKTLMASAALQNSVVSGLRTRLTSRDLLFEKSSTAEDNAVYVVNPSRSADARLVVDLELKHQ